MKKDDSQGYQANTTPASQGDAVLVERIKQNLALLKKLKEEPGWSIVESTKGLDFSDSEKEWFCEKPEKPAENTHSWFVLKVNEGGFFRRLWRRIFGYCRIVKPKTPPPGSKIIH
jgi:hypothetical protein